MTRIAIRSIMMAAAFAVSILVAPARIATAGETVLRAEISLTAQSLLMSRRFDELDRIQTELLVKKQKTPTGRWQLTIFDQAIRDAFSIDETDEAYWREMEKLVSDWTRLKQNSANAHLAYTEMLINRAWSLRGSGYGGTVATSDWKLFHAHLEKARLYLERQKAKTAGDPRWYDLMIQIAGLQNWPPAKYGDLAMEGIKAFPDYHQIYQTTALFLLPKWGGNAEAVEAFAQDAIRRAPPAEAASIYVRIYWNAFANHFEDRLIKDSKLNWPLMKKGMEQMAASYPDPFNLNMFARFGCMAWDRPFTASMFKRLRGTSDVSNWNSGTLRENCRNWASKG